MCVSYKKKNGSAVFQLSTSRMLPSSVRSRYIRVPLTTAFLLCKNAQLFCKSATRHPCRALNKTKIPVQLATSAKFPALCVLIRNCSRLSYLFHAVDGALRGVPAGRGSERPYERSKGKTTVLRLRSEKDGSEGEASPFVKDSNKRID